VGLASSTRHFVSLGCENFDKDFHSLVVPQQPPYNFNLSNVESFALELSIVAFFCKIQND
jgi:hypothetical protein